MLSKVINQVLVKPFYERHSGLLFFLFFLSFGIVESSQVIYYHLSLMYGMITSPIFLGMVSVGWCLYSLKVLYFNFAQLSLEQNQVIMELGRLSKANRFIAIIKAVAIMDLPVLIYSGFIIGVALFNQYFQIACLVILIHILRNGAVALMIDWQFIYPHRKIQLALPAIKIRWIVPAHLFFLTFLNERLKTATILAKLFTLACLMGILRIDADPGDIRIPLIGIIAGFAAHSVLVFEFRKMEDHFLDFQRSLPLTLSRRFLITILSYAVLFLPEFALMIVNKVPFWNALWTILFCLSLLLVLHVTLYIKLNMDSHVRRILMLFLLGFLTLISKLFWISIIVSLIYSFVQFNRLFYRYEPESG